MINEPQVIITLLEYEELKKKEQIQLKPLISYGWGWKSYANCDDLNSDIANELQLQVNVNLRLQKELFFIKSKWWFKLFASKQLKND